MLNNNEKVLYTVPEAMDVFGMSLTTIWRWRKSGELETVKYGRSVRITAESIRRQLANNPNHNKEQ